MVKVARALVQDGNYHVLYSVARQQAQSVSHMALADRWLPPSPILASGVLPDIFLNFEGHIW